MLSKDDAKKKRERSHSPYAWTCPLCGKACHGNGGQMAHQSWHLKKEGSPKGEWGDLVQRLQARRTES